MALLMGLALLLQVEALAAQAGVDPIDLQGAVNSTGLEPAEYLYMTGELQRPRAAVPPTRADTRVECIIWHESRGVATARNPRSGASGLGQFLPSTWRTTPQGRAGLSVFDPSANRAAVAYMLAAGRAREFEVVTRGLC